MAISSPGNGEHLNIETVEWEGLKWLNIEKPTRREIDYLAATYHFNQFDLDDCLSRIQIPKIDEYNDYLFLVLHFQVFDETHRVSSRTQVSVFIGKDYLITLHTGELKHLTGTFRECQANETSRREYFKHGSGYLLYRILDHLADAYFLILDKIMAWVESVEDKVFNENVEISLELAALRRDIITQRHIIFPLRTLTIELGSKIGRFAGIDMAIPWGDLIDHENKMCAFLDEFKETIEVYKDTDYVLSTERLNTIMRTLTIISTIMLPLIVLSGLWSMNVPLPFGGDPGGSPYFFYVILAALLATVGGMLFYFRKKHWI
jgi:magnesium transporter